MDDQKVQKSTDPPLKIVEDLRYNRAFEHFCGRPDNGNVGFFFNNYGGRATDKKIQSQIDRCLTRNPGTIIGLGECQAATEAMLRSTPERGPHDVEDLDHPAPTTIEEAHYAIV